jgi:hypothetical protein
LGHCCCCKVIDQVVLCIWGHIKGCLHHLRTKCSTLRGFAPTADLCSNCCRPICQAGTTDSTHSQQEQPQQQPWRQSKFAPVLTDLTGSFSGEAVLLPRLERWGAEHADVAKGALSNKHKASSSLTTQHTTQPSKPWPFMLCVQAHGRGCRTMTAALGPEGPRQQWTQTQQQQWPASGWRAADGHPSSQGHCQAACCSSCTLGQPTHRAWQASRCASLA